MLTWFEWRTAGDISTRSAPSTTTAAIVDAVDVVVGVSGVGCTATNACFSTLILDRSSVGSSVLFVSSALACAVINGVVGTVLVGEIAPFAPTPTVTALST